MSFFIKVPHLVIAQEDAQVSGRGCRPLVTEMSASALYLAALTRFCCTVCRSYEGQNVIYPIINTTLRFNDDFIINFRFILSLFVS